LNGKTNFFENFIFSQIDSNFHSLINIYVHVSDNDISTTLADQEVKTTTYYLQRLNKFIQLKIKRRRVLLKGLYENPRKQADEFITIKSSIFQLSKNDERRCEAKTINEMNVYETRTL
jgi:outer membrane protein assembly factor BamD (BamD/ComL family)